MRADCYALSNRDAFWVGVFAGQGEAPECIAEQLGLPLVDVVAALAGYAAPPLPPGYERYNIMLAAKDRTRIAAEAVRRGIEMPDLASMVLQTVARDELFGAVL